MKYRMVVNMENKNALITNAMLASYINSKHIDYLGMIEPFVIKLLPQTINTLINIEELSNNVNKEFGIPTKQKIIEKILIRLSKNKNGNLVKRESYHSVTSYYTNTVIDTSKFDKRKEKMKELVNTVVVKLMDFINEKYIIKISYTEAEKYFIDFLTSYSYDLYKSADELKRIQGREKNTSSNFKVAKFILTEFNDQSCGCYSKIKEIQEGYFASLAIYYFCESDDIDNHNPIKTIENTLVILDTRLLIDVLGLNRSTEEKSMNELLTLIKENGGSLCTFDYYVDELDGIITKYLRDKNARVSLDLEFFRRNKTSDIEIELFIINLKEKLKRKNIEILYEADYSEPISQNTWHIDTSSLRSNMSKFIDYEYGENNSAFENDFKSLQAISYFKHDNINKSIFVTSNSGIVYTAKHTFTEKIYKNDIDIVISDIDLTAILWLSNYNSKSNLSDFVLLENAYAAISPSKEILNEALRIIESNINSNEEEIRSNAFLMRYNEHLLEDVVDITENDNKKINENFYKELNNRYENRIRKKVISDERKKLESEIRDEVSQQFEEEYQNKYIELQNKNEELFKLESNILLKESEINNNLSSTQERQSILENENADLKNRNIKLNDKFNEIRKAEIDKCEKIASFCARIFRSVFSFLISIFMLFVLYICSRFAIYAITKNTNVSNIFNQLIALGGTILTYIPVEKFCLNYIRKISNSLNDYIYSKLYNHSNILNK